jgi:large subunit ribosomal protein L23
LKRPIITEKVTDLNQLNKYVFEVPVKTSKSEVAKAITNVYGVKPVKVNVINVGGKRVRRGRRFGKTRNWRKAIVTLAAGESIEVYEGV